MNTSNTQKSAVLFAVGSLITLSAISYLYIEQRTSVLPIGLAIAGMLLALIGVFTKVRSSSTGTIGLASFDWNRLAMFAVVFMLCALFLVSVNHLSKRLPYRWDVTQYDQHTLTQATIDFVTGIDASIEEVDRNIDRTIDRTFDRTIDLTAFYVGLPPKYLQDLLNEYARISNGRITVKIVDPIEDIAYAAKFGNVISGAERKLILTFDDERKDIDFSDQPLNEEQITNALIRLTRDPRVVYLLSGHGELSIENENNQGLSQFADLLSSNNIRSKTLMLGTALAIPDDCDVLIIAGPRNNLSEQEERLLKDYLKAGGDALLLIEAVALTNPGTSLAKEQIDKAPSLNSILNDWGIHIGDDIVVDLASHIGGDQGSPATKNYGKHAAITAGLDYTFYIRPRSITALPTRRSSIELAPIALTSSEQQSWAETDRSLQLRFDEGIDIPGPVAMSYVIWEGKEAHEESDTRIIAVTDADFLSNAYLKQYSNAAMGLNLVNWLAESDYVVFYDKKDVKVERLDLTSKQRRLVTALLFLLPLLIGLTGIFVKLRSR